MDRCPHGPGAPAAFELLTAGRSMRYSRGDDVLAAASTFGGRWRVTDVDGIPLFSLAPAGAPGTDDRDLLPNGGEALVTFMRDRRQLDSWIVVDHHGVTVLRATRNGPYEMLLTDPDKVPVGRVFATSGAVVVELDDPDRAGHCLALALPLYFTTTGALQVESLQAPTTDLALWE